MPKTQKVGSGSKKHGRDKRRCEIYRLENKREKNKKLRQERRERKLAKRREKREILLVG